MKIGHWQKVLSAVLGFAAIGALLIWASMNRHAGPAREQEMSEHAKTPPGVSAPIVLTVAPQVQEKSGISTVPLKSASYQKELKAYGEILSCGAILGMRDRYATAKAQLESVQASYAKSSKIYERRHELFGERIILWETLQGIEATQQTTEANISSARTTFQIIKGQIRQEWGPVLSSWIYEESSEFNRLSGQDDVLIQVTLPSDVTIESPPEIARIETSYGVRITAKLVSAAPRTDPRIQGQSFYYVAPAREARVIPGMSVTARLAAGGRMQGVIVPFSAVVWVQGSAWIYVREGADHFVRRELPVDNPVHGDFFVERGLFPGQSIVVKGAQLLLSEEFRSQIVEEG